MQVFLSAHFPPRLTNIPDFTFSGVSVLLEEYALDRNPTRFALCATLPIIFCVSIVRLSHPLFDLLTKLAPQFFCLQLIGNICLIFGPVAQYHENSMYYSAVKPEPNPEIDQNLPHITIQMPVYKESLVQTM
jgi:hypothetical protein